jgi:hypothetical protein
MAPPATAAKRSSGMNSFVGMPAIADLPNVPQTF